MINLQQISFKLDQPSSFNIKTQSRNFLHDTRTSHIVEEECTPNPYRHSYHLWKYLHPQYSTKDLLKNDTQCNLKTISRQIQDKQIMENFDSFQHQLSSNHKPSITTSHQKQKTNDLIRVQQEEFSLIEDNLNEQIGISDLFDKGRTTRTLTEPQDQFFFLTSNISNNKNQSIRQFYFNLNTQNTSISESLPVQTQEPEKIKVKKIIYDFIDDLEKVKQDEINPDFIPQLKVCLKKLTHQTPSTSGMKMTKSIIVTGRERKSRQSSRNLTQRKNMGKENKKSKTKTTKKQWI